MERYVFLNGKMLCAFGQEPYGRCSCFHCKKENVQDKEECIERLAKLTFYPMAYHICCHIGKEWLECRCSKFCTLTPEEEAAYKACKCNYCQEDKM